MPKKIIRVLLVVMLTGFILSASGCKANEKTFPAKTIEWVEDENGFIQFFTNDKSNLGFGFLTWSNDSYEDPMDTVEIEVKKVSGNENMGYGILFCFQNPENYYRLLITTSGWYRISAKNDGEFFSLPWMESEYLNQGLNEINKIKITRQVNTENNVIFSVCFNENEAAVVDNSYFTTFTGGYYGFYVGVGNSEDENFPQIPVDVRFKQISPLETKQVEISNKTIESI